MQEGRLHKLFKLSEDNGPHVTGQGAPVLFLQIGNPG